MNEILDKEPALGLLAVAVPTAMADIRHLTDAERLALGRECGQYIAEHGDDLMFRGRKGAAGKAFAHLARGLAALAYQPGGVTFAGMHFCTDHEVCKAAEAAGTDPAGWIRVEPGPCICHQPPQHHNRWVIKNPLGDGKDRLITDKAIRTFGRAHVEELLARLPPLPEQAWEVLK